MNTELERELVELKAASHLCLFYNDPVEHIPALVSFIEVGLRDHEKCIFVAENWQIELMANALDLNGTQTDPNSTHPSLQLWTRNEWRLPDPPDLIKNYAQVQALIDDARAAGFKGIRFSIDMNWTQNPDIPDAWLMRWEALLNQLLQVDFPTRMVCQYNRQGLSPHLLQAALRTHSQVVLGNRIYGSLFYEAPLISNNQTEAVKLNWMIGQLEKMREAEKNREAQIGQKAALAESERVRSKIQEILGRVTDGFIALDREGRCTFINPAAASLLTQLEKSVDDVIGKNIWDIAPALVNTRAFDEYQRAMQHQVPVAFEYYYPQLQTWFDVHAYPSSDGLSIFFQDITARKRAEERQAFLAQVTNTLASSLDYRETLTSLAKSVVSHIADWCAVDILDDNGSLQTVAVAHVDPEKIKLAEELRRQFPPDPQRTTGVHHVLRTGEPDFRFSISADEIAAAARDAKHLELLTSLGLGAYIIAPLATRGRTFGAITLAASRTFEPADLMLAQEIALRAALFVDNARLYSEARQLNSDLEKRVQARTADLESINQQLEMEIKDRKQAHEQLQLLSAHLQTLREDERIRIARELHDELGQALTAIKIDLSMLDRDLNKSGSDISVSSITNEIRKTIRLTDDTVQKMRRIVQELRPEILDQFGLSEAADWQIQQFQMRTGIRCQFESRLGDLELTGERATALFRILQEALTNVARHSGAERVDVMLGRENGNVILQVHDYGKGLGIKDSRQPKSFGILGMRERASALKGELHIQAQPGKGTTVFARIPVE